jgi:cytochrome c biogenesis protein CcdA
VLALLALVVSVGLLDSANPSTVGPALYLATAREGARGVAKFLAGVFAVSLAGGLVLTFGPGKLVVDALPHPGSRLQHELELGFGALALLAAIVLWLVRSRLGGRTRSRARESRLDGSALLLGAGIMAVELPTAVPYFAVVAALVRSDRAAATQVALLLLFNVLFVAPLLLVLCLRLLADDDAVARLERFRGALHRHAGVLLPLAALLVGLVLVTIGATGLL